MVRKSKCICDGSFGSRVVSAVFVGVEVVDWIVVEFGIENLFVIHGSNLGYTGGGRGQGSVT